ncbi:MAG: toxin-antitoxin ssytem toxin component [Idiomarinaceae bacterium HL-53]|nr:MAG: toxin-antitoxin ssytem toxin component [Idiomarinaceae bacterium HL-53]CUS47586.1 cell division inhibitor SulA [Idiomarinaceae bacterium HL-53]
MNSTLSLKKISHPGLWGHEQTTNSRAELSAEPQLWAAISTMRQQPKQWVTLIGKPSPAFLAQLTAAGIPSERIRCITSSCLDTAVWATEQALLLNNSQLVIAWLSELGARDRKRLQLAARNSTSINFLFTNSDTIQPLH